MSRPSAAPRYYESEHELQRLREELFRPRAVLRKHQSSSSSRPRDLQLVEDPPASSGMLAWVDRFVAPPPTSPTLKSAPPIGTLHVQVSPDDSTYRVRNIRPDGARTHVRRPSAQEVQDRLRQLPSANNHHPPSSAGVIGNLPMRSNSFNRRASNHLPPSPAAAPIAPVRRHQPGTADLHLRLNVQDVNPVWDGSQDRMMVERGGAGLGGVGPRPPLIRAPPPPRPPRPNNVNIFDDDLPTRPPPLSLSSSTSSSSSSGQSSRNPSPQTPTSPATPSAWTSYYTDRGNDANSEQQQQVEPPLPPLPAPMARSPPASMGFGRRAKSPPSYSTRAVRPTVNLTGGTTASGSLTSIGNLMTTTSPIPTSPIPESTLRALGLDVDYDDSSSPFSENALNAREEERTRERALRRSASTATRRERSLPPPPEPVQEERGRHNRRERSRPPRPELAQEEPERQNAFSRRERSQPPPPEPAQEEPERQNAFSRLRDFTRARSKSLGGRDSSRRRRTPSPPSRAPPLPTSPLVSTPNSARTIRAPGSPRPLYHMDFLAPHTDGDNNGPQSRPHSIAVSESSVITAGGTRYNIRNKALRVVNAAPSATSGSSRGSIASRSSLGSTITALFSHSTSSKSSVSDKTTTSSSKSSERLESLKARALEEDIYRALNLPHVPYYSPSPSSRGDSPLPPPSFTFQDYSSSPRSSILSSPSSPRAKYAGINVDPQNRLEFDVRRTLEELSLVEEEVWGKGRVQAWEKEPDLENTDDAAMGLETLVRVERKKRGRTRPERRGPIALRVPRR